MHAYGAASRIGTLSMLGFRPSPERINKALKRLAARGLVTKVGLERTKASPRPWRIVYEITEPGWRQLGVETSAYRQLFGLVDRAQARRAVRQKGAREAAALAAAYELRRADR